MQNMNRWHPNMGPANSPGAGYQNQQPDIGGYPSANTSTQMVTPSWTGDPANRQPSSPAYPGSNFMQTLSGKIVQSPDDITVNDVPMNGGISIFPAMDGSYILIKTWNNQGTIDTYRYIPDVPSMSDTQSSSDDFQTRVFNQLDNIEKMLKQNRKPYYKKPNNQPKKEGHEE